MSGLLRWFCVLALAGALSACGDDSSGGADGGDVPGDGDGDGDGDIDPISEMITADDGGEIVTQGASINIPAGALSEDTEITVDVILATDVPEAENVASLIYDFGPDGTTFSTPVELTIALNGSVPSGMEAKMAWLDEESDKWMPLADSQIVGDEVTATTTHFTMFAIVIKASGQTEGACTDFADFDACGGDVEGTWEFFAACADVSPEDLFNGEMPFGECPDLAVTFNIDLSGSVTFEAGGAYNSSITRSGGVVISVPESCLMGATCEQAFAPDPEDPEDMSSFEVVDGVCEVMLPEDDSTEAETGTYELDDNMLIMQGMDDTEADAPQQYCVQGNTITVRNVDIDEETGNETVVFFQATRQ